MSLREIVDFLGSGVLFLVGQVAIFWPASILPGSFVRFAENAGPILGAVLTIISMAAAGYTIRSKRIQNKSAQIRMERDREIIRTKKMEQEQMKREEQNQTPDS